MIASFIRSLPRPLLVAVIVLATIPLTLVLVGLEVNPLGLIMVLVSAGLLVAIALRADPATLPSMSAPNGWGEAVAVDARLEAAPLSPTLPASPVDDSTLQAVWIALLADLKFASAADLQGTEVHLLPVTFGSYGPTLELTREGVRYFCWPARDPQGHGILVGTEAMPVDAPAGAPAFKTGAFVVDAPGEQRFPLQIPVGDNVMLDMPATARAIPNLMTAFTRH